MKNQFFSKIEQIMTVAQQQADTLKETTLKAKEACIKFVTACDDVIACNDEDAARELIEGFNFPDRCQNVWEQLKAVRELTQLSIDVFDEKIVFLTKFSE